MHAEAECLAAQDNFSIANYRRNSSLSLNNDSPILMVPVGH